MKKRYHFKPPQGTAQRNIQKDSASSSAVAIQKQFLPTDFWNRHWLPVLLLLAVAFILYGSAFSYGYLMDDQLVMWDNIYVQKGLTGIPDIFAHDSFMGYYQTDNFLLEGGRYRPLSLATFALEIEIFGKNKPGISHFVNILLYGATGVLLFGVLTGIFPLKNRGTWYFGPAFISTIVFLTHPLHSEAVVNIKGRDEIMALLGSLGTLYAAIKFFDTQHRKWLLWASVLFAFALFSKENAITYLAVIPMVFWMFSNVPAGRIIRIMLPLFGTAIFFIIIRYKALGFMIDHGQKIEDLMNNPFLDMSIPEKYATIFLSLGWYVKLLFFPHPLTHDYYPYQIPKVGWNDWRALLSLGLYLFIGIWAVRKMFRSRDTALTNNDELDKSSQTPAFAILYFLVTLSIASNLFINVGTFMNERFVYMPSVGFALLTGWFLSRKLPCLLGKQQDAPYLAGYILLGAICLLYAFRVWTRVPDWSGDGTRLVESAVLASPNSCRAQYYYGNMLYYKKFVNIQNSTHPDTVALRRELLHTIEKHLDRALEINPDYKPPMVIKSAVAVAKYQESKRLDALLSEFESAIKRQPYNGDMLTYVCNYTKAIKGAEASVYNSFCHRIGYDFYYKQKFDLNGAAEFLNYSYTNGYADERILQDLVEVYTALGDQRKVAEMQGLLLTLKPSVHPNNAK